MLDASKSHIVSLLLIAISLLGAVVIVPIPHAHAQGNPTVYISPASRSIVPRNTLVTFNLSASNLPSFAGWDTSVKVNDTAVLNPVSINVVEASGGTKTILSNCVNGVGQGCGAGDGGGVLHSAVNTITGPNDSGNVTLFSVTFNSTTTAGFTHITLPLTILLDPIGNVIPVVTEGATYGNPLDVPVAIFTENPAKVFVGDPVAFNAIQSYDPSGGKITLCLWETDALTGILESLPPSTAPLLTLVFPSPGTFTMALIVFYDNGARSEPTAKMVSVQVKIIILTASPNHFMGQRRHGVSSAGSNNTFFAASNITVNSPGAFAGPVDLRAISTSSSPRVGLTFSRTILSVPAAGSASALLHISIDPHSMPGTYFVIVTATGRTTRKSTFITIIMPQMS